MGFDASLRQAFPLVIGFALGTAAYLQAWGLSRVVASSLQQPAHAPVSRTAVASTAAAVPEEPDVAAKTAAPILGRNPFDSVTGPLDRILDHPLFQPPDPEAEPVCDGARVVLIAASSGGRWSFAAILGPDGMPVLRREGDAIAGRTVVGIGWDRVWLARDGARCQIRLGHPATPAGPPGRVAATPLGGETATTGEAALTADIKRRIHRVGEREVEIDRSAVGDIFEHYAELVRRLRIAPEKEGVRLFGIRPGSVLEALGLSNGDRVESIDGLDVRDPREAIEAYTRLQNTSHMTVAITRGGKKQTLDVRIR